MSDQITELRNAIDKRVAKIQDVDARLERQNDHIRKIEKSRERYLEHRERWVNQNARDMGKLTELGVPDYQPVKAEESPNADLAQELGIDPEELDDPIRVIAENGGGVTE